jgi:hypothetical protein
LVPVKREGRRVNSGLQLHEDLGIIVTMPHRKEGEDPPLAGRRAMPPGKESWWSVFCPYRT